MVLEARQINGATPIGASLRVCRSHWPSLPPHPLLHGVEQGLEDRLLHIQVVTGELRADARLVVAAVDRKAVPAEFAVVFVDAERARCLLRRRPST